MKNLTELREYVWDFIDTDNTDISENLLDSWAQEGFNRIVRVTRTLPFYENDWTVSGVAGEQSAAFPADLESIEWIAFDGEVLEPIGYREAVEQFGNTSSGIPTHYTIDTANLILWPEPSSDWEVAVHGWRKPNDWVAGAGTPDFPAQFEPVLLSFMLYRAYGQQGLTEDAFNERAEFDSQLSELIRWELAESTAQPMVLGGGRRSRSGPKPLTFPIRMG